jgi:hypothetical protein
MYAIIVQFNSHCVAIYWATFPSESLKTIRTVDINSSGNLNTRIELRHTQFYNLFDPNECTEIIRQVTAPVCFIAMGEANVDFFRKGDSPIHRPAETGLGVLNEIVILRPPQEDMDTDEERI